MKKAIVAILAAILCGCRHGPAPHDTAQDKDRAIAAAKELFRRDKAAGMDMTDGPCLSSAVIPDWCVDVAHYPREPIDDDPAHECSAYRNGGVHHCVELDPDGNLIRTM